MPTATCTVSTENTTGESADVTIRAFQKQIAQLSKLVSSKNTRIELANELYSSNVISNSAYKEAMASQDGLAIGSSLICSLHDAINEQPHLLKTATEIFKKIEKLCPIAEVIENSLHA